MIGADTAPRGTHAALEQLISLRAVASRLPPHSLVASGRMFGPQRARRHGRGIDFEEVRAYLPGDDVRAIDWRVTARSTEAHIKVFREDREQPLMLLVDQSPAMFFGSRCCYKSVQAAHVAALLAWAALRQGHPVGGISYSGADWYAEAPRRDNRTALRLLHRVAEFNRTLDARRHAASHLGDALMRLERTAPAGSLIWLISDFNTVSAPALGQLSKLLRRHDIVVARISDIIERELGLSGTFSFSDSQGTLSLAIGRRSQREYHEQRAARERDLRDALSASATPLIEIDTADGPLTALLRQRAPTAPSAAAQ